MSAPYITQNWLQAEKDAGLFNVVCPQPNVVLGPFKTRQEAEERMGQVMGTNTEARAGGEIPYDAEYERKAKELEEFTGVGRNNPRCFSAMQTNRIESRERQLRDALAQIATLTQNIADRTGETHELANMVQAKVDEYQAVLARAEAAERMVGELSRENAGYKHQISIEAYEVRVRGRWERDGYWRWQGDAEDHLESLTCPIVIMPEELRELLKRTEAQLATAREALGLMLKHYDFGEDFWPEHHITRARAALASTAPGVEKDMRK